jgi:hypothetical protein
MRVTWPNGYLDTAIDWILGMEGIRLKDIPSFIRTTDPNNVMLNFDGGEAQNAHDAHGLILDTRWSRMSSTCSAAVSPVCTRSARCRRLPKLPMEVSLTHWLELLEGRRELPRMAGYPLLMHTL